MIASDVVRWLVAAVTHHKLKCFLQDYLGSRPQLEREREEREREREEREREREASQVQLSLLEE